MSVGLTTLLVGCASSQPSFEAFSSDEAHGGGFVKYEIKLKPNNNGEISLPNARNCKIPNGTNKGNRKGCIRFERGTYGVIIFSLRGFGEGGNRTCSDGAKWVITKVRITGEGNPDNPDKGANWGTPVEPWLTKALFPFETPATGTLYDKPRLEGKTTVGILNRNINEAADPKDFWYEVSATKCRPDRNGEYTVAVTDPRVENDGR